MCDTRNPEIISFNNVNNGAEPAKVMDMNYIIKCVENGKLLTISPSDFKSDLRRKMEGNGNFFAIDEPLRITEEHCYAGKACFKEQSTESCDCQDKSYNMDKKNTSQDKETPWNIQTEIIIIRRWVGGTENRGLASVPNPVNLDTRNTINPVSRSEKEPGNALEKTIPGIEGEKTSNTKLENVPLSERLKAIQYSKKNIKKKTRKRPTCSRDETTPTSSHNSDSSSEDEEASSAFRRTTPDKRHRKITPSHRRSRDAKQVAKRLILDYIPQQARKFSQEEQCEMIEYLIVNRWIGAGKGYAVWKRMLKDGFLKNRTYQSLHNNFRKFILPNIHTFEMDRKYMKKFKRLQRSNKL